MLPEFENEGDFSLFWGTAMTELFSLMLTLLKLFNMIRFSIPCVIMLCKRDKIFIFKGVFVLYETCFESLLGSSLLY